MSRNSIKNTCALILASLLLLSCQTAPKESGYLTSYEGFRDGPEGGVDRVWSPPGITTERDMLMALKPYKKVIFEPIWVSMKDKESYDGLDPQELVNLTKLFRVEIESQLAGSYPLVTEPGPGVMRLRIALTGIEVPSRAGSTLSSILPVGLVVSFASKAATGEHTNVGSATMEALITDSVTGNTIIAAVDRRAGEKGTDVIKDPQVAAKNAFKWWAQRLRVTLDKAANVQ